MAKCVRGGTEAEGAEFDMLKEVTTSTKSLRVVDGEGGSGNAAARAILRQPWTSILHKKFFFLLICYKKKMILRFPTEILCDKVPVLHLLLVNIEEKTA